MEAPNPVTGPLAGRRILEVAGIGPGPFCAMLLADMGAEVVKIDRAADVGRGAGPFGPLLGRGRRSLALDLKRPEGLEVLLRLVEQADALLEGFRPGVAERLGFGPDVCLERNPRLVFGRMTGWGQTGPWAGMAGHDINYISLSGALGAIGRRGEAPVAPLNLVGDFGGGGMLLAFGVLAALLERERSGKGQVVDASMVEGSALLMAMIYEMIGAGAWGPERGTNALDTGAPFYDVYETADGGYVSFGSLEPQFFAELVKGLGLDFELPRQMDPSTWPELRKRIADAVRAKTRDEWEEKLRGTDVCFAPVLHPTEAPSHPQNVARQSFVEVGGVTQPGPAPRFSRTPAAAGRPAASPGEHSAEILRDWGFGTDEIERYRAAGGVRP